MKHIVSLILALMWISGIVIAKGFWSTLAAVFIWPWGWYLVVEFALNKNGLL